MEAGLPEGIATVASLIDGTAYFPGDRNYFIVASYPVQVFLRANRIAASRCVAAGSCREVFPRSKIFNIPSVLLF
jgi:hypothetical protein